MIYDSNSLSSLCYFQVFSVREGDLEAVSLLRIPHPFCLALKWSKIFWPQKRHHFKVDLNTPLVARMFRADFLFCPTTVYLLQIRIACLRYTQGISPEIFLTFSPS